MKKDRSSAAIIGVGRTAFGNLAPADTLTLQSRAATLALNDAGLGRDDIDGLLVGYAVADPHLMPATRFAEFFGLKPVYAHGVQSGGATGLTMVALANHLVAARVAKRILVVAGENRLSGLTKGDAFRILAEIGDPRHEVPNGGSVPSYYALLAARYLHDFNLEERDLAEFAVLMRRHATDTPGAHFNQAITVDDVLASKPVSSPLKLLDCCPVSDGAAAVVVACSEGASTAPRVVGTSQAHTHQHLTFSPSNVAVGAVRSSESAFAEANRTRNDVGRISIYDSFTATLAILIEACGFSENGRSSFDVRNGRFNKSGALPLNTHGGLLSYGHSGVAGGLAHLVELVVGLREDIQNPRAIRPPIGFCHAEGGVLSAHVSMVLECQA